MPAKTAILIVLAGAFVLRAQAQEDSLHRRFIGVSAGLGVTLINANDVVNFINVISVEQQRQDNFATAAEFFGEGEFQVAPTWGLAVEYSYLLKSYNLVLPGFSPNFIEYKISMPTLIAHYVLQGEGYFFKFGGGLGYHSATLIEQYPSGSEVDYRTNGLGLKVQAVGNTEFDEHLYGYIAVDARKDFMGEFKDGAGAPLSIPGTGQNVSMNFFSAGVKFGLSYFF